MFYSCDDERIKYTGRWGDDGVFAKNKGRMATTACGAKIEFLYKGADALLHFDTYTNEEPFPHLYITVDGGARTETALSRYLRIRARTAGVHRVEIIYKSAVERQHRWHIPLVGKATFLGVTADGLAPVPPNNKKTVEFIGDSITEGVLVDGDLSEEQAQEDRPFSDDVTATYAYLTAEALNLEPYFTGYGAVGITRGGMGGVPKAIESYPYVFEKVKKNYPPCDYILINHGANDGGADAETYVNGYGEFLDTVRALNPNSVITVLSAFCGAHHKELGEFIARYNKERSDHVYFIDSTGWIPERPLHPLRDGHRAVADRLIPILRGIIESNGD